MIALVNFYSYCGSAGDLQEMLTAESSTGVEETILYTRGGYFEVYNVKRAKKKLLKRLKKKTGKTHYEIGENQKESL